MGIVMSEYVGGMGGAGAQRDLAGNIIGYQLRNEPHSFSEPFETGSLGFREIYCRQLAGALRVVRGARARELFDTALKAASIMIVPGKDTNPEKGYALIVAMAENPHVRNVAFPKTLMTQVAKAAKNELQSMGSRTPAVVAARAIAARSDEEKAVLLKANGFLEAIFSSKARVARREFVKVVSRVSPQQNQP